MSNLKLNSNLVEVWALHIKLLFLDAYFLSNQNKLKLADTYYKQLEIATIFLENFTLSDVDKIR